MTNHNNPQAASGVTDAEVNAYMHAHTACLEGKSKEGRTLGDYREACRTGIAAAIAQSSAASAQNAAPVALLAEPVAYQSRLKPDWRNARGWSEWEECSKGHYQDRLKSPTVNNWQYEVRALYLAPPVGAGGSVPAKFNAWEDAERLKSVGRGLSYNDHSEAVWKHAILEIAMRLETDGYIAPRPTPAQGDAKDAASIGPSDWHDLLSQLVEALTNAHISSWQTTAGWQKELDQAVTALAAKGQA